MTQMPRTDKAKVERPILAAAAPVLSTGHGMVPWRTD
jgi:hypothetical protein